MRMLFIELMLTVVGVDDTIEDGDVAYTIITDPAESLDPNYDNLNSNDVQVANQDDDAPTGGGTQEYPSEDTPKNIPDNVSSGVSSTIAVGNGDEVQFVTLTITLDISHPRPNDLTVTLMGPDGTVVPLTNLSGDNDVTEDFPDVTDTQGPWTLKAVDDRKKKEGTINSWTIKADY
jgi:serine protease